MTTATISRDTYIQKNDKSLLEIIEKSHDIISLVWPLETFIATNPLHDLSNAPFFDACMLATHYLKRPLTDEDKLVNRHLIKWALAYFDVGEKVFEMPYKNKSFYEAFCALSIHDKTLHEGNEKKIQILQNLMPDSLEQIETYSIDEKEEFFRHEFAKLSGWAGFVKWLSSDAYGKTYKDEVFKDRKKTTMSDFLAVRLVLASLLKKKPFELKKEMPRLNRNVHLQLLEKREAHFRNAVRGDLVSKSIEKEPVFAQFVFCIDVRSEPYRRLLENEPGVETFGFAGFFGLPVRIKKAECGATRDICPAILNPHHEVHEEYIDKKTATVSDAKTVLHRIKHTFATAFFFAEITGALFGLALFFKTVMPGFFAKVKNKVFKKTASKLSLDTIPFEDQCKWAKSALLSMGLKKLSKLVVFCGHASSNVNNPYKSALQCGACGANEGGASAQLLASILNDETIQKVLQKEGFEIETGTQFIAAEHDTTTDELRFFSEIRDSVDAKRLKKAIQHATIENQKRRAVDLQTFDVTAKAKNWAEVRPEWGLARNGAFIIGPRNMTKGLDLKGRAFLHSYDYTLDPVGSILESILRGPLMVAHWINLQYFFSSVYPDIFGSGSKVTQNVIPKIGVMQGVTSDLMSGLSRESLFTSGDTLYHDPIRLQVFVACPEQMLQDVIKRIPELSLLIDNEWLFIEAV